MKTIGIIGAMDEEIAVLKPKLEMISAKSIVGTEFYMGKLRDVSAVVVRCGIGKVNAAVCVQVLSDMYGVDCIINTGVAGGLDPRLSVCDVVISKDVVQHDFDATMFGYEAGIIPRMPVSFFEADSELVSAAEKACDVVLSGHKAILGRIASGDLFVSRKEDKDRIINVFSASCVEMEGAAIGHACYLNKIPFVIIRAMSDTADGGATEDFNKFVIKAAEQSGAIVERMLLSF
ncbi:MAG: 5'-methylthioadenosine/adenosylhomocysteine nucleosidase [Defluviitaleaceae bacterium]|nr:5'-methylthioadenosine/adenosylhomocysteine nucleosidase [Defluviitaleaceae bacterium]MCL2835257.1 5'-methylthioadenosine/adenosylhomocysteine nucleosidase [Defluviitaleaceae bacterium]